MTAAAPPALQPLKSPERCAGPAGWRLGQWYGFGGLLLALLVLCTLAPAVLALTQSAQARTRLIDGVEPATMQALRMASSIGAQESALRAYVATRDPYQLAAYRQAVTAEAQAGASMHRLLAGVPGSMPVRSQVTALSSAAAAWRAGFADPVISDVPRAGRGAVDAARDDQGRRLFAAFRAANVEQQRRLNTLHSRTARALRDAVATVSWTMSAAAAIIVLAAISMAVLIRRTVVQPVGLLTDRVRQVAQGEFAHPLDITGPAEITELAGIIDSMRHRIIDEWRIASEARELIDEQALELRRSNAELEQFAYVASHDLQEPLRKVASFCQMIERRYGDKLDERGKQYIDFAVDGAKRMQLLINDLLSFSRVGRFSRTDGTVSTQDALGQAIDNLSYACADTSAEVVADPLPEVTGDLTLLTQLFQNLIGNAVKFRGDDLPRVRVGVRFDGEMWEFFCSDNGIGIEPRYADRIFLIFQRLHPQDEYTGTGIGLAMCKKIVEYHGGRIWLDTGTGTAEGGTDSTDGTPGRTGGIGDTGGGAGIGATDGGGGAHSTGTAEVRTRSTGTTIRWTLPAAPKTVTAEAPIDGQDAAAAVTTASCPPGPPAEGGRDSDGADPASGGASVDTAEQTVSPVAREASAPGHNL